MGKLGFSLILAILLLGSSTTVWASHNGPIFFVDDNNPPSDDCDGDYHFHSLAAVFSVFATPGVFPKIEENDTVVVDPGSYATSVTYPAGECPNITLSTLTIFGPDPSRDNTPGLKGVIIKAPGGRDLTKFSGQIVIEAKDVQIIGLDVDANGTEGTAFTIRNDNALLQDNKAHNAEVDGIWVTAGSDNVTLIGNEVFANGSNGLLVSGDSDNVAIQNNLVRNNGSNGIFVTGSSDRATITENDVSLNNGFGIEVAASDNALVRNNTVVSNSLTNIIFTTDINGRSANGGNISENSVRSSNSGFGIKIAGSDNNLVRENTVTDNLAGGIQIISTEVPARRNQVENNILEGNIIDGSAGIQLKNDVSSNILQGNTISNNGIGVYLLCGNQQPIICPSNNSVNQNEITDSPGDGVLIAGTAGRNRVVGNSILRNNANGVNLSNTVGNDEVLNNKILNNGHSGVLAFGSPRNTISFNQLQNNGRSGVTLIDASDNSVLSNTISHNGIDGVLVRVESGQEVFNTDIEDNTITENRRSGVRALGALNLQVLRWLDLRGNTIASNVEAGVWIENSSNIDIENNQILNNNKGGINILNSQTLDIEQNNINNNFEFGLNADVNTSGLVADRNWWGSSRGPSGVFEGRGNAILGTAVITNVFPWLTAPFEHLMLGSTSGEIIDDFGLDDPSSFLAMDKADIDVNFFKVDPEEDGMVIVSRFESDHPEALSNLSGAVKAISVLVSGLNSGTTLINIQYNDSELLDGTNKDTLRLFYYDGNDWVQLDGRSRSNVNIVEGEIPVQVLRDGVILAIAPGGNP